MTSFSRYPHVKDLINYYALTMEDNTVPPLLEHGFKSEEEAVIFSQFIWRMMDQIGTDAQNGKSVLGRTDNTDTMPDIDYEVSLFLANCGYAEIWDRICDEQ
jgi:hypothetical protein